MLNTQSFSNLHAQGLSRFLSAVPSRGAGRLAAAPPVRCFAIVEASGAARAAAAAAAVLAASSAAEAATASIAAAEQF